MKKRLMGQLTTAFVVGWCISAPVPAAIDLLPKELVVHDEAVTARIVNHGDRAEYVSISLSRLLNPGVPFGEEKLEPVIEMATPALYVFPFRISLAPGQSKTITLKPLHAIEQETVYRLDVRPVVRVVGQNERAAGSVVVNFAFSGLVRQLPDKERSEISVTCDARGVRITAIGNVRYTVEGAKVDGRVLSDFNVYPGVPQTLTGRVVTIPGQPGCDAGM